jgi:hypothetical protein
MTGFFIKAALKGYINGFYYPLLFQDHMDDPKSSHCRMRTEEGFRAATKVTAVLQYGQLSNLEAYMKYRERVVENILDDTFDPRAYQGWRDRLRRGVKWAYRMVRFPTNKPAKRGI